MAESYIVVVDLGTSRPRCHLFGRDGMAVATAEGHWTYAPEGDAPELARAFDPPQTWDAIAGLVGHCLDQGAVGPGEVAAVAVTGQRQGVAFLDGSGKEIYLGPNLDLRGVFEGAAIDQDFGDDVYRVTGHLPSMFFTPAKLRWFQANRPAAYGKITSVLTLPDWLTWRLTGVMTCEVSLAGEAGLMDVTERQWCASLMGRLGLMSNAVPLVNAGTVIGKVRDAVAQATGLAAGTPVIAAGADTQCGLLGMKATAPRQVGVVAGWSAAVQMVTGEPVLPENRRTWTGCSLYRGRWILESSPGDTGNAYRWLTELLWDDDKGFERMDSLAAQLPPGAEGVMAFLGHRQMDMANVGMRPGGFVFPVPTTFSGLGKGHLARAAIEATAFSIKANLEQLESLTKHTAVTIALGGGMTRAQTFERVLAGVLGREIQVSKEADVSAVGAYLCARTGIGDFPTLEDASANAPLELCAVEPDPGEAAEYADLYGRWSEAMTRLEDISL